MSVSVVGWVAFAVAALAAVQGWRRAIWLRRQQQRAELQLMALQDLLLGAPLAVVAWSPKRGVLTWNAAAEYLCGLPRDDVLGRPLPDCLAPLLVAAEEALEGVQAVVALPVDLRNARGEARHVSAAVGRMSGVDPDDPACIAMLEDLTARRQRESRRVEGLRSQRDALVREVHHRIKNHLQGVAGLLRQHLSGKPELKGVLDATTAQVLSIAAVHGLQGESERSEVLDLRGLLARIAASISGIMQVPIVLAEGGAALGSMQVSEEEAVPMAMVLNELLMNAVKHRERGRGGAGVSVAAARFGAQVTIRIGNDGMLPASFDFERGRDIGTGLGLVKSLLPSHGARLVIAEEGERVVATLSLGPPHVTAVDEAAA